MRNWRTFAFHRVSSLCYLSSLFLLRTLRVESSCTGHLHHLIKELGVPEEPAMYPLSHLGLRSTALKDTLLRSELATKNYSSVGF